MNWWHRFKRLRGSSAEPAAPWSRVESDPDCHDGYVTVPDLFDAHLVLVRLPIELNQQPGHCLLLFETARKVRVVLRARDVRVMRMDTLEKSNVVASVRRTKVGPDDTPLIAWVVSSDREHGDPGTLEALQGFTALVLECCMGCMGTIVCEAVEWSSHERAIAQVLL